MTYNVTPTGGSSYNPANVSISGGTINNTPIGGTTSAAGAFSSLTAPTRTAGDSTTNVATTAFVSSALSGGTGSATSVTSAGSTTARTLAARFADVVYALDYGVKGDGLTDDTTALQAALNAAQTKGKVVLLPAATILINGSSGVTVPAGVTLAGESNSRPYVSAPTVGTIVQSSVATGSNPIITLNANSTLLRLVVYGPGTDGFGAGTSRPCISVASSSPLIHNVTAYNGYRGIDCNYNGVTISDCQISGNLNGGITNPVDSHICNNVINSCGACIMLGAGANSNMICNNRFEFTNSSQGVQIYGASNTTTIAASAGTSAGSAVLTFTSTSSVSVGTQVYDQSHTVAIPLGTYVVSKTATTVTLSANVTSPGVSSGDTIEFYTPGTSNISIVGNSFDRCYHSAISIEYGRHITVSGNVFNRSASNATANTQDDSHIFMHHSTAISITGNTSAAGKNDDGTGTLSPSYGVWDGGANAVSMIRGNCWIVNPVNGTNSGGINTTSTFSTFNTDNVSAINL